MALKTANTTINGGVRIDDNRDGFFDTLTYSSTASKNYNVGAQGINYGYNSGGGVAPPTSGTTTNVRFPFAGDSFTTATAVADLVDARFYMGGNNSETYGYTQGGTPAEPSATKTTSFQRFNFTNTSESTTSPKSLAAGRDNLCGTSSETYGYNAGGYDPVGSITTIERFPFASDTSAAASVGDLIYSSFSNYDGISSKEYSYAITSAPSLPNQSQNIERFPFAASTTNSADVGDLTVARGTISGHSSYNYGYAAGGRTDSATESNVIDRFSFASGTENAADVGDLAVTLAHVTGTSSAESGYSSSGWTTPPNTAYNNIQRFPFALSTTNATDIANLTANRFGSTGNQY